MLPKNTFLFALFLILSTPIFAQNTSINQVRSGGISIPDTTKNTPVTGLVSYEADLREDISIQSVTSEIFSEDFENFDESNWFIGVFNDADSETTWGVVSEGTDNNTGAVFPNKGNGSKWMYFAGEGFTRDPFGLDPLYANDMHAYFSYRYWVNANNFSYRDIYLFINYNMIGLENNDELKVYLKYEGGEDVLLAIFDENTTTGTWNSTIKLTPYIDNRRFYIEYIFESNWIDREVGVLLGETELYFIGDDELTVNPSQLDFNASGGSGSVSVSSNTTWTVSDNRSWISVSGADENGDDSNVRIEVDENTSTNDRSGTVTFTTTSGDVSRTVNIDQEPADPADELTVYPSQLDFNASGGSGSVSVSSNTTWTVSDNRSWISVSGADENGDDSNVRIEVDENTSTNDRSGTVTFTTTSGDVSRTVNIDQEGLDPPVLTVSEPSLEFGTINVGDTDTKSYTLSGSDLTTNVSVTAPSGFEVSTNSSSGFRSSITVTESNGSVNQIIYVRFSPTNDQNYSGEVTNSSSGATTKNVSVSGEGEVDPPVLTVSETMLEFGTINVGDRDTKSYTLSGSDLTANVSVTAPSGFEVSTSSSSGFSSSITVNESNGSVNQTIYVRFSPSSPGDYSGTVSNSSAGATSKNVSVSGEGEVDPPVLTVSETSLEFGTINVGDTDTKSYTLTGSDLTNNVSVSAPNGFEVSTNSTSGFSSEITVTQSNGSVNQTIYVRFSPTSAEDYSGTVSNSSSGATSKNVTINGSGISDPTADITPFANLPQTINQEYWVEVKVGENDEVEDLFGISFKLNASGAATNYVVDSAEDGGFLGNSVIPFFEPVDDQTVDMAVTKTSGSGVSGSGVIARAKFKSTQEGIATFNLLDFEALDSNGNPIIFDIHSLEIEITAGVPVWPGDTNHDGVVSSFDVLFVGQCYGEERPGENNPGNQWRAYLREDWVCVCEDANGDGVVDGRDILPIGLNYGKTHDDGANTKVAISQLAVLPIESKSTVILKDGFLNITFELTDQIYGLSGSISSSFGLGSTSLIFDDKLTTDDYLSFTKVNEETKTIDFALSSLNQNEIINAGNELLIKIKVDESEFLQGEIEFSKLNLVTTNGEVFAASGFKTNVDYSSNKEIDKDSPFTLSLSSNYPNPFNPSTTIKYTLDKKLDIQLSVYSMSGQLITTLVEGNQAAGEYSVVFDASGLASGNYIYRLETGNKVLTRSMTLIK